MQSKQDIFTTYCLFTELYIEIYTYSGRKKAGICAVLLKEEKKH